VCTTSGDNVYDARVTATVRTRSSAPAAGELATVVEVIAVRRAGHAARAIARSMDTCNWFMKGPGVRGEDVAVSEGGSQEPAASRSPMDGSLRLVVTGLVAAGLRDRPRRMRSAGPRSSLKGPRQLGVVLIGEGSASAIQRGAEIGAIAGLSPGRRSVHGPVVGGTL
jgi:hypothetical protein